MDILILADIHANYPALEAVNHFFNARHFDLTINCGDSIVYGPFPNETLRWLQRRNVYSILGNTDRKVIKLLKGGKLKKPKKKDKRIMYTWTKDVLDRENEKYLRSLKKESRIDPGQCGSQAEQSIHVFHGSPDNPDEFLFADTPTSRFRQLAEKFPNSVVLVGHSHTPFYKRISSTHFINPGSIGRMFDGDPSASCATLRMADNNLDVQHHRIPYRIQWTVDEIKRNKLPNIYATMYLLGRKLN